MSLCSIFGCVHGSHRFLLIFRNEKNSKSAAKSFKKEETRWYKKKKIVTSLFVEFSHSIVACWFYFVIDFTSYLSAGWCPVFCLGCSQNIVSICLIWFDIHLMNNTFLISTFFAHDIFTHLYQMFKLLILVCIKAGLLRQI